MLRELQRDFLAAVRGSAPPRLQSLIAGRGLEPAERLMVYANNHRLTLTAALAGAYPVLARTLGGGSFHALAARYLLAHPSRSGDLHGYGAALADVIAAAPSPQTPWLAELARLEWAVHTAYFAAEMPALALAELRGVAAQDHPRLRFAAHPALGLVASAWPVLAYWEAVTEGADEPLPPPAPAAEWLLVLRAGTGITIGRLDAGTYTLLAALAAGATVAEACADALAAAPDLDPGTALGGLLARGALVGFHL